MLYKYSNFYFEIKIYKKKDFHFMNIKDFKSFINEKLEVSDYDSDRKWFVVNVEEGSIVSAWDYLQDALIDGLMEELISQGLLEDDQTWDFKDNVDSILGEFGYYDNGDDDDVDTEELNDLIRDELGVKDYVIRNRSEL